MVKCDFVDPSGNNVCGKSFQAQRLMFIDPTSKMPMVYHVCGNHANLRFGVLNLAEAEIKSKKDKNQINWQESKDAMSEIWNRCRRCNEDFKKDEIIWVIQYFKFSTEISISVKKVFRVHKECALRELFLYGVGKDIVKDKKLDLFS